MRWLMIVGLCLCMFGIIGCSVNKSMTDNSSTSCLPNTFCGIYNISNMTDNSVSFINSCTSNNTLTNKSNNSTLNTTLPISCAAPINDVKNNSIFNASNNFTEVLPQ